MSKKVQGTGGSVNEDSAFGAFHSLLKNVLDVLPDAVLFFSPEGELVYANESLGRLTGYPVESLYGQNWLCVSSETSSMLLQQAVVSLSTKKGPIRHEVTLVRPDKSERIVSFTFQSLVLESGGPYVLAYCEDLTTSRHLSDIAVENERRLGTVLEAMSEGVVFQDRQGRVILNNEASELMLGLSAAQLDGRDYRDPRWMVTREDGSSLLLKDFPAQAALATGEAQANTVVCVHKPGGDVIWLNVNAVPVYDGSSSDPYAVVSSFSDITDLKHKAELLRDQMRQLHEAQVQVEIRQKELKLANQQLREIAEMDVLTTLKNRRGFFERLAAEIAIATRNGIVFSVVLFDIDHFKSINDQFGHQAGDEVLTLVGKTLKAECRTYDFIARYGGEEFALILPHTNKAQAAVITDRLLTAIRSIRWQRQITASAGISEFPSDTRTIDEIVEKADQALYSAKAAGRNQFLLAA